MRLIFVHLIILLVVFVFDLQGQQRKPLPKQAHRSDTICARFSMFETIRGDTVLFKHPTTKDGLLRYFHRNLRYPLDSVETISCKLFFIIDKEGHVTDAWCAPGPPDAIAKEVVRVAQKMGSVIPSYVKGKPVVTRVETRIVYFNEDSREEISNYDNYENDILIRMWGCRLPARPGPLDEDEGNND